MKRFVILWFAFMTAIVPCAPALKANGASLCPKEQLGKLLFFDPNLSVPEGQSCAVCHGPEVGFTGPEEELNKGGAVYEGAERGRFGNRKPPASSYGGDSPVLHFDKKEKSWVGGMFWDGRATGKRLKDPLAEQAQGPFLNPLEQNIPDIKTVCIKIKNSSYAALFEKVWGKGSLDCGKNVSATYDRAAKSIAAYERSKEANPFTSKFDYWLRKKVNLSDEEKRGLKLFEGKGKCAECHPSKRSPKGAPPSSPILPMTTSACLKTLKTPFTPCLRRGTRQGRPLWIQGWAAISKKQDTRHPFTSPKLGSSEFQPSEMWTSGPPPIS